MIVVRNLIPPPTHFHARQFEWGMAGALLLWALNLALTPSAFDQPTFVTIRQIAPPAVWTWACVMIALVRVLALYINGTWRASPFIRAATATLSGMFWAVVSAALWSSGIGNTGWPIYACSSAFDLYGAYQASKDARIAWDSRVRKADDARPRPA